MTYLTKMHTSPQTEQDNVSGRSYLDLKSARKSMNSVLECKEYTYYVDKSLKDPFITYSFTPFITFQNAYVMIAGML